MSGVPVDVQVGRSLLELFPAHRVNGLSTPYVDVVETGAPFDSGSFHYLDPDAAGGPLDQVVEHRASKMGDGYVLSVRDITEHHRAEREMRHLATAIEQSSDAVVVTDASGTIEYVNPAFEQVSGYCPGGGGRPEPAHPQERRPPVRRSTPPCGRRSRPATRSWGT